MNDMSKKRPLTDIERRECDALDAIYKAKKKDLGLTQEKIALEGLKAKTQSAASHYLKGKNALNVEAASVFARYLQVDVGEFSPRLAREIASLTKASGTGTANIAPALQPRRAPRAYPLISWIAAGEPAESPDNYHPGDGEEMIESTENAGPHGYWLKVKGDSMTANTPPSFPEGTPILVQPEGFDLVSGKFYIFKHGDGEKTFKQYVRESGVEYLAPLNRGEYKTVAMSDAWQIIGRVVDAKITGL